MPVQRRTTIALNLNAMSVTLINNRLKAVSVNVAVYELQYVELNPLSREGIDNGEHVGARVSGERLVPRVGCHVPSQQHASWRDVGFLPTLDRRRNSRVYPSSRLSRVAVCPKHISVPARVTLCPADRAKALRLKFKIVVRSHRQKCAGPYIH
jgi:hypothetical protein